MGSVEAFAERMVKGAGLVGAITGVGMTLVVLLGGVDDLYGVDGVMYLIVLGAAVGAMAYFMIDGEGGSRVPQVVGALAVGAVALAAGVVTGFGWLEICGLVGAVAAAAAAASGVCPSFSIRPWALGWVILGVSLALVPQLMSGGALDHDEAAYALKARTWLEGAPESGWDLHRGIGMSVYAYPVLALGGGEAALRVLGWVSLLGLAAATWRLGRRIGGAWVGPAAAVMILASPSLLGESTDLMSDIPSAALVTACMVIVWRELGEPEVPSYRLLTLLPLAWSAFYLRYQSVLSFGFIAVVAIALWRDKIVKKPGPVFALVFLGLVGFMPHFFHAAAETGSPIGILTFTATSTGGGKDFTGRGLDGYGALFGWSLAPLVVPVLVALAGWWYVASRRDRRDRDRAVFLLAPAAALVLFLGFMGEAYERFVFISYALLAVAGALGFSRLVSRWRASAAKAVTAGLAIVVLGAVSLAVAESRTHVERRVLRLGPLRVASSAIREEVGGESCGVLTSYEPQINFYSRCMTDHFYPELTAEGEVDHLVGRYRYMLLLRDGKRQPEGAELSELEALAPGVPTRVGDERDWADLYRFER